MVCLASSFIVIHMPGMPSHLLSQAAGASCVGRRSHTASCGIVLTGGSPRVKQSESGIEVKVPEVQRRSADTIVKLQLDGPAGNIAAIRAGSMLGRLRCRLVPGGLADLPEPAFGALACAD